MKIAVMGTGVVGRTLATRLAELGHEVAMGARDRSSPAAAAWAAAHGWRADDFAGAAEGADLVVFAVLGTALLSSADAAGSLAGKVVLDVTNPLDFSQGFPPSMVEGLANTTSAGEALQAAHPEARVVKALNTMSAELMVAPHLVPGAHDLFLCGNDAAAKALVAGLLEDLGWQNPIDLGDITAARGTEGLMLLWLRLYSQFGDGRFNWHIAR